MRKMKKEQFVAWAQTRGWQLDRFGHLKKETNGKTYRFKLSRVAVRDKHAPAEAGVKSRAGWVRLKPALVKTGVGLFLEAHYYPRRRNRRYDPVERNAST